MTVQLSPHVNRYLNDFKPSKKDIASMIINIALELNPEFDCEIIWDQITFTLNQNWHHWIFAVSESRQGVTVSFHKGALLRDPRKILKATGSHLKTIKYEYREMVDPAYLRRLINEAVEKQTEL
jgi:hypothetical protein